MEGQLERVYLELEALPTVSIPSDDDTDPTEESDSEYDSDHDSRVDMRTEDDEDALHGVDLDGDVDMEEMLTMRRKIKRRKMKRREMRRRRIRMRRRMRMRMMAKNLKWVARDRW